MKKSAIEEHIESLLVSMRSALLTRDRGILLGFLLTCVPFPPVTLFGILINIWNYRLSKNGRFCVEETRLITWAFFIGAVNLIFGTVLLVLLSTIASAYITASILALGNTLSAGASFIGDLFQDLTKGSRYGEHNT